MNQTADSMPSKPSIPPEMRREATLGVTDTRTERESWLWRLLPIKVRRWLQKRFGDVTPPIRHGFGLWLAVGAVIAIPEIWAAAARPPWPTISGTVGHLETRWNFVAVIVVAVLAIVAAHAIRIPITETGALVRQADGRALGRTPDGRLTLYPEVAAELSTFGYLGVALVCVIGGSFIASALSDNKWILGYVIYGLIAIFFIFVPSILALTPARNAPFAGVFATLADLQRRLHFVAVVLLAGLVILLIHLAFYPWPDVFRHHPGVGAP
jgi:hypothetical protein